MERQKYGVLKIFGVVLLLASLSGNSFAQTSYATLYVARDGNGGSQDWIFNWSPQDVTAIEIRYRPTDVFSASPNLTLRAVAFHDYNSPSALRGENWLNDQISQMNDLNWRTSTLNLASGSLGATEACAMVGILLDDNTSGTSGDRLGVDLDYIRVWNGATSWDFPLADDGSRQWAGRSAGWWATANPHGVVVGGTFGSVVQLDMMFNVNDEQANGRFHWGSEVGSASGGLYPFFEWTWRTAPGDATDSLDIAFWLERTDYGWYNPPGCWWGYFGGNPATQPPLNWATRQCSMESGANYQGLSWDLSDSPFSGGLSNTERGIQIDTMVFTDGVSTTLTICDGEPDPNSANTGMLWTNQPSDYLVSRADYTASNVNDWMLY